MSKLDLILRIMNYELDRPFSKEKKKVITLMKDELRGKNMTKFVGRRAKTYIYLIDNDREQKWAKGTKTYVMPGRKT